MVTDQVPAFFSHLFLASLPIHCPDQVMHGDSDVGSCFAKLCMETVMLVLALIRKVDFMFYIDLKDAYSQIPVHPESCPFLCFIVAGKIY